MVRPIVAIVVVLVLAHPSDAILLLLFEIVFWH